ncbi:hypothetical protein ACIFOC_00447 [Leucobacter aridicollis]
MEAPYAFINAELELIELVRAHFGTACGVEVESPRPAEFVQLIRVGGTSRMLTDRPMVICFVWGATWDEAWRLAAGVKRYFHSLTALGGVPVYKRVEIGGLAHAPDPVDGSPRYQFTFELRLRGYSAP